MRFDPRPKKRDERKPFEAGRDALLSLSGAIGGAAAALGLRRLFRRGTKAEEGGLRASPGDRLVLREPYQGESRREAEIVEVLGEEGSPPFIVRWSDDGELAEVFIDFASCASVEHAD